eukprot:comp6383_c0_seq1/m.2185 comp6383_c0_seq1/g.2185  ORF comp6383_c0_seq1/g.2185 comp6383_c0_seq1/m.2185 type:complete len:125 (-) comp6383_c0_seq1:352-726(-)
MSAALIPPRLLRRSTQQMVPFSKLLVNQMHTQPPKRGAEALLKSSVEDEDESATGVWVNGRLLSNEIVALHAQAVKAGEPAYIDPLTGFFVLTSEYLRKKGPCCGNACRHCPYGHSNVGKKQST